MARIASYQCTRCNEHFAGDHPINLCPSDGGVLYVRYDLDAIKSKFSREALQGRVHSMWRYADVLPDAPPVTLGEGFTPMLPSRRWKNAFIKEEAYNPTGSFKARGLCLAVTMAKHHGHKKLAIPSAGNAGSALAAYCAAAGMEAHIFMPKDVPIANQVECKLYGAKINLIDGLISDCGRMVAEQKEKNGWFDVSTLKEPFRVEGKKTMGYEIAEQMQWELPAAIFYPTGGGVGMIGMWKAFEEMEALGWIGSARPKMIAVQAAGCAPIAKAMEQGKAASEMVQDAKTFAAGLRVPKPYGDYIVIDIVKKSGGQAIAVSDVEMRAAISECAEKEGLFVCPEGAASFVAYEKMLASGSLSADDKVVLFNTGSGLKYMDVLDGTATVKNEQPRSRNIGGIIGPY